VGKAKQSRIRSEAQRLLAAGVAGQVFPGATAAVAWREAGEWVRADACAGKTGEGGGPVEFATPYDLASVTKPFVATAALRLVAAGKLSLDARPEQWLPDTRGTPGGMATLEELLTHRAGLAPWGGLYLDVPHEPGTPAARRWIVAEAARRPDENPGAGRGRAVYSDLGYIVAGETIARAANTTLDKLVAREVTQPLGVDTEVYYAGALPPAERAVLAKRAAATERCDWRGRVVRGEVHDENCAALGGVGGHAGLFGSAAGVAALGRAMLDARVGRGDFLPPELVATALATRPGTTLRLGWDGRASQGSSAGRRISPAAFGHLGFTGTSLWCDPDRELVIVLLTNRVHPSRANDRIRGFRPAFHDAIVGAFDRG
jgi:CubicO group peptidase (beta-lactamase class C family)